MANCYGFLTQEISGDAQPRNLASLTSMPTPAEPKNKILSLLRTLLVPFLSWFIIFLIGILPFSSRESAKHDIIIMLGFSVMVVAASLFLGWYQKIVLDEHGLQAWYEIWKSDLEQALNRVAVHAKHSTITLSDYFKLLADTDAQTIQFMGTMVGYSYAMFKPLSQYAVLAKGDVLIDIIGTRFQLAEDPPNHLVIYPVSLIVKTLKSLAFHPRIKHAGKKTLRFYVHYLDKDILNAFMAIGLDKIMIVQALAPQNADFIFNNQYEGQIFTPESTSDARVDRYFAAFRNIKSDLSTSPYEEWKLTLNNGDLMLSVTGITFWRYNKETNAVDFDDVGNMTQVEVNIDRERLRPFVTSFYERLAQFNPIMREKDDTVLQHWDRYTKLAKLSK